MLRANPSLQGGTDQTNDSGRFTIAKNIESYTVVWKVTYDGILRSFDREYEVTGNDFASAGTKINTLEIHWFIAPLIQSVEIVRIETTPNDRVYGGGAYSIAVNRNVYSDS